CENPLPDRADDLRPDTGGARRPTHKIGAVVPLTGRYGAGGAQGPRRLRDRRRAHQRAGRRHSADLPRAALRQAITGGSTVRANRIKQIWRDGKCVTLGWLSVPNSFTAEVMARQGFDALCVDLQHGLNELSNLLPMMQAVSQTDTVPVVRVPWNDPAMIMKALDVGAYGIIVPLVNTAAEAAAAVAACRYPPVGFRSSGPIRAVHYGGSGYQANADNAHGLPALI